VPTVIYYGGGQVVQVLDFKELKRFKAGHVVVGLGPAGVVVRGG